MGKIKMFQDGEEPQAIPFGAAPIANANDNHDPATGQFSSGGGSAGSGGGGGGGSSWAAKSGFSSGSAAADEAAEARVKTKVPATAAEYIAAPFVMKMALANAGLAPNQKDVLKELKKQKAALKKAK